MTVLRLETEVAELAITTRGGAVLGYALKPALGGWPLLRPALPDGNAAATSAFPLVPFGNRVRDNSFAFDGQSYRLASNTADACRLHGDGWLEDWHVERYSTTNASLTLRHRSDVAAPWDYLARLDFALDEANLTVRLGVTNLGDHTLPFGLGWHPYFPLTPSTRLTAPASSLWLEGPGFLPTETVPVQGDLDFGKPTAIPGRWLNNGFDGWPGRARIDWPERDLLLSITADAPFRRYVLFRPDRSFDPSYEDDYFCFEPMSHAIDGFHLPDLGGLTALTPGTELAAAIRLDVVSGRVSPKR